MSFGNQSLLQLCMSDLPHSLSPVISNQDLPDVVLLLQSAIV